MKRKYSSLYAGCCTILLALGFLLVFYFAWNSSIENGVKSLIGFFVGFALSPVFHELGHVSFGAIEGLDYVYVKCFCFKIHIKNGKKRFSFASPFAPDQTQVLPKTGGNMKKRAALYTLGGLIFEGTFLFVILAAAILISCLGKDGYLLWGIVPYAAYLFLFNVVPAEYPLGKTDMAVYVGIRRGGDVEKNMLAAMEIQGKLYEGKSFTQIDRALYFDLPQLREDEPLFQVMLDLRYRYYLEAGDQKNAASTLNRLAQSQAYLSDEEVEKVAAELVYMHSINGDLELAEESGKLCRAYLMQETLTAKRILVAFSAASGTTEAIEPLLKQAEEVAAKERIEGVRKFEKILLSRIQAA